MLKKKYGAPNRDGLIDYISHCKRNFAPGSDMTYSCLNFITLQRIIETVSGEDLQQYAHHHVFDVLGMKNTDYNPSKEMAKHCAPTEKQDCDQLIYLEALSPNTSAKREVPVLSQML